MVELLVVIAIIGILAAVAMISMNASIYKARVRKMAADLRQIRTAWSLWQSDTGAGFYPEDDYATSNVFWPCHDEPTLDETDLGSNILSLAGWNGPYMSPFPTDPFGKVYGYDNDKDTYSGSAPYGGVNVFIGWCTGDPHGSDYIKFAQDLDKIFDNGDGWHAGLLRWDGTANYGQISFLISPR